MTKLTKTETLILNQLQSTPVFCSVVSKSKIVGGKCTTPGSRERTAVLSLMSKGLVKMIPNQDRGVIAVELV